jgi:hypothetical protein
MSTIDEQNSYKKTFEAQTFSIRRNQCLRSLGFFCSKVSGLVICQTNDDGHHVKTIITNMRSMQDQNIWFRLAQTHACSIKSSERYRRCFTRRRQTHACRRNIKKRYDLDEIESSFLHREKNIIITGSVWKPFKKEEVEEQ